ncbi:hypothetical protein SAMN06265379_1032 [Saccharicrinis carchari]|uniref:Uncharacterized protein n=1 Tax=Saccharicrinis carchari TaxID=1168039 RepID=A0A521CED5_SACCC|nr:hypothetical protein [Saccharicrinis carchari]SMO57131.1 hypothetical protein SAMN06265379_1032 [Saccharicrinis carchari]
MPELVGDTELSGQYYKKGKTYEYYFTSQTHFMRDIKANGTRDKNINPRFYQIYSFP